MTAPLILIDASSYFFRAFHALPPLTTSKGQPTGAIYGVVNMIKKLIKDYSPKHIGVIFDAKGKTFRDEWYPDYKAHRAPMPSELSSQFEPLLQLLKAMGLPLFMVKGVEADDVIGTLTQQAKSLSMPVLISTGDKDMAQLVNGQVSLINTMTNFLMDMDGVKEKFGVLPDQMIDYLTLIGDTTDNIPGVTKCGPKTAIKWLEQYQTLDNLLAHADTISGKIGEYLRASIPQLPLSKRLVTIKTDLEIPLDLDELTPKPADTKLLIELTREYEFKNWLKELLHQETKEDSPSLNAKKPSTKATIINFQKELTLWINHLQNCSFFCINIECTSLNPLTAGIAGISLAINENQIAYIPLGHLEEPNQLNLQEVLKQLKPILENPSIEKIGFNLKQDYTILNKQGISLNGLAWDVMLQSYILSSHSGRHDLDTLSLKYLGNKINSLEELIGAGAKQLNFAQIPVEQAGHYASEKTQAIFQLHLKLRTMMDESLQQVFKTIEMPLIKVLADMELLGVLIDDKTLNEHGLRLKQRVFSLEEEALQLAGRPFNLNSPKQLQEILFEELKLPVLVKTPKGQPSTGEAVLQELAFEFRLAAVILEYRSLTKLISTYIDALPLKIHPSTKRVHTHYNQAVAATGRLSSSEPNLQNIPIRSEEGKLIRTAFIAPPKHLILAADYSQIELRIMAHLSKDEQLLKAFTQGWDIHAATASELFETPLDKVTYEQRRRAKAVNFGLIYGMSSFGLAKQLGIDRQEAQLYIDTYFQRYPRVLAYMNDTRQSAHELGYVETLFGRRLFLPEINARNIMRQKAAERMAINAPMQGTAADIIKKAMLDVALWQSAQTKPEAKMIMQVHDELVFEIAEEALEPIKNTLINLMEHTVELSVPLVVSVQVGTNWGAS